MRMLDKIARINRALKKEFRAHDAPIIELIEAQTHDPFCVLVGTILSARTKDACTAGAVKRLFATAAKRHQTAAGTGSIAAGTGFTIEDLERLSVRELEKLIYPVGFYHDKARHLAALSAAIRRLDPPVFSMPIEEIRKKVDPNALVELLCSLPGVGRKTANLTVAVGFNLPAICVDVHVHRICNWLGLVKTSKPVETEMALRKLLPVKYWKTWNSHLVSFGQTRCDPVRPRCSGCPISAYCHSPKRTATRLLTTRFRVSRVRASRGNTSP